MQSISIHALVKRATAYKAAQRIKPVDFNPRPREEGDDLLMRLSLKLRYFNPRPREEGDYWIIAYSRQKLISIHALVKRATDADDKTDCTGDISIHALVKRATKSCYRKQT